MAQPAAAPGRQARGGAATLGPRARVSGRTGPRMRAWHAAAVAGLAIAMAATGLLAARWRARPAAAPPAPMYKAIPPEDAPDVAPGRFLEVTFDSYAQRPESDFVARSILPALGARRDRPLGHLLGLADVTNQGVYMLFVQLTDARFCDDGCRTLAYRWSGTAWRLVADERATRVVARRDLFVYRTRDHGDVAWHWRGNGFERER